MATEYNFTLTKPYNQTDICNKTRASMENKSTINDYSCQCKFPIGANQGESTGEAGESNKTKVDNKPKPFTPTSNLTEVNRCTPKPT